MKRDKAFKALTAEERSRVSELLPGYFVRKTPSGEVIRGYTANIDECVELIDILAKVDFMELLSAADGLSLAADNFRAQLQKLTPIESQATTIAPVLFEKQTPAGKIIVGGTGNNTYTEDVMFLVDLGGDDIYLTRTAATSLDRPGASVLVDLSGNDTYKSTGFSQGSAVAGVTVFMDLDGDDHYISGDYSQGAALCGHSFFYEGGGDDSYSGDLGVQCFSIFGYSIFSERSGRDSYICSANGQGSASTLGVSILAEGGGDDLYRAGGKYGFYFNWDSSCGQGAASGMRSWPPAGKMTVYGGIGFLSEARGRDVYHAYNIGQGGSYIFALGMLVDAEGNDTYYSERYCRGVGVHLGAAVALDYSGDDIYTGFYGNNGYSLDRSSGVFADFGGNDSYRTSGGIGFGHKPKGTGIFFDASGNDTYGGWENNYGKADYPFGDEAFSTGFFLDLGGKDVYFENVCENDKIWRMGTYGFGEDREIKDTKTFEDLDKLTSSTPSQACPFDQITPGDIPPDQDPVTFSIITTLNSPVPLIRFEALKYALNSPDKLIDAINAASKSPRKQTRRQLIDLIQVMTVKGILNKELCVKLKPLLSAADYDMRLLALNAVREMKPSDPEILRLTGGLALSDPSWEVRSMACLTLSSYSSKDALQPLLIALSDDPDWRVRRRAAMALSDLKNKDATASLTRAFNEDPAFQVRAYAAQAVGRLKSPDSAALLEKGLVSGQEFIKCLCARSLVLDFSNKTAMKSIIELLDWENGPMRDQWITTFLTDFTGQSLETDSKKWMEWWSKNSRLFNIKAYSETYEKLKDARKLKDTGKDQDALKIYRNLYKRTPGHAGVAKEMSELLNSISWNMAIEGKELADALKLAKESVELSQNSQNLDTAAVLYFLTGDKVHAEDSIKLALEKAGENEKEQYKNRLEEFKSGKLVLH